MGPFKVVKKVGNLAYCLDIPQTMRIHLVISIAHLEPCPNPEKDPYKRPRPTNPPPVMVEPGDWQPYEVEKILNRRERRYSRGKRLTEYLVCWKGYGPEHNEWYGEDLLGDCLEIILDFKKQLGNNDAVSKLQERLCSTLPAEITRPDQSLDAGSSSQLRSKTPPSANTHPQGPHDED